MASIEMLVNGLGTSGLSLDRDVEWTRGPFNTFHHLDRTHSMMTSHTDPLVSIELILATTFLGSCLIIVSGTADVDGVSRIDRVFSCGGTERIGSIDHDSMWSDKASTLMERLHLMASEKSIASSRAGALNASDRSIVTRCRLTIIDSHSTPPSSVKPRFLSDPAQRSSSEKRLHTLIASHDGLAKRVPSIVSFRRLVVWRRRAPKQTI
jgi:hypothetical protein